MKFLGLLVFPVLVFALLGLTAPGAVAVPFSGTIFVEPNILTSSDPTAFLAIKEVGQDQRRMFDRRGNSWISVEAFLFEATYEDDLAIEIQVNPEFGDAKAALAEAERYAPVIGQLPRAVRRDVRTVWIHKGVRPFGGGNNNLLIHTGQADRYVADGILEETLIHEASHTSLDADHARAEEWLEAQSADDGFVSGYARDNPVREDIAESFLLYLAFRHREDRISRSLAETIAETMPNRLDYFDRQEFDLRPMVNPVEQPDGR